MCTYCDCSISSKRMHCPLICYECRIFLKEDEEHEKEQQAYEDRRQAKYKAQIAGDNDMTQTDKEATDKASQHTNDGHTYEVLPSPSPPRAPKFHTYFHRQTSTKQKGLAKSTTDKTHNIPSPQSFHVGNTRSSTNSKMDRTSSTIPNRLPAKQTGEGSDTYHQTVHNKIKQHDNSTFPR